MWTNGLVIGKFYPPHAGHQNLIQTAQRQVEHLTVLVCRKLGEQPEARLRSQWLQELHPQAQVQLMDDIGDHDNSQVWADYTLRFLGHAPDVVFTSEDYGVLYAKYMGCDHVLVDRNRQQVSCAGRWIRRAPYAYWQFLPPPVRAYYALRIAIVGAESTGTTTLARDLAHKYETAWVPEYGRLYSEGKWAAQDGKDWRTEEFLHIARMQNQAEDELARLANKVLICDTTAFATAVWHERYLGFWSEEVEKLSAGRQYGLHIITEDSIPFVQDGLRDGQHIRHEMHLKFLTELQARGLKHMIAQGSRNERLREAKKMIDALLPESQPMKINSPETGVTPLRSGR